MARLLQRSLVQQYGKLGSKMVKIGRLETWLFSMIKGQPQSVMDAMNMCLAVLSSATAVQSGRCDNEERYAGQVDEWTTKLPK